MKLPFFFFKKRLRKYSSRVVAGYKAALSPCYRKGRYKKDEGRGRSRDARYSGSGSIVKEEKERRGRERVVIQDLFSQTVTAGPVLLARFKGYRIPHRFCQHLPLICRGNGKPIATTLLHHRTSKKNIFLQQWNTETIFLCSYLKKGIKNYNIKRKNQSILARCFSVLLLLLLIIKSHYFDENNSDWRRLDD